MGRDPTIREGQAGMGKAMPIAVAILSSLAVTSAMLVSWLMINALLDVFISMLIPPFRGIIENYPSPWPSRIALAYTLILLVVLTVLFHRAFASNDSWGVFKGQVRTCYGFFFVLGAALWWWVSLEAS